MSTESLENRIKDVPIRISILGSTGSIGRSALDVVRHYPDMFEVVALGAFANIDLLTEQIREFRPSHVAIADDNAAARADLSGLPAHLWRGCQGFEELAGVDVDVALCAMVGAVGLKPVLRAIEAGNRVALANKEPLVIAGSLIMDAARRKNVDVLPVDSEHNAIFQCLEGHSRDDVHRIHLTASGGPFYGKPHATRRHVTPEQAAKHPTWDMGEKISVDSATLMNKGLEVIEAMWLFGMPLDKISVIIHPQSIIHSLVEFNDGSILAQMGPTDMKFPILFSLTWPKRVREPMRRLDLTQIDKLTFAKPDFSEFPCLRLALESARTGGTAPAVLNAANEIAVQAFCEKRIPFLEIPSLVEHVLSTATLEKDISLQSVLAADSCARDQAKRYIAEKFQPK
ncbi:MAG: 1-deoxy-D-xylulose-5-phosphate reductoisomerase [Candidatus Hydrogenedentota bacterium]